MSGVLEDLRQRWVQEATERAEWDAVVDLVALDEGDSSDRGVVDGEAALCVLHGEPDDDQPWRVAS